MRSQEEAFIKLVHVGQGGPFFLADPRSRQADSRVFDQFLFADDVAASLGDPAAGVLDQGAGHKVDPAFSRLMLFRKFPIAVVDEDQAFWADLFNKSSHFLDLVNRVALPGVIAPRPLDDHDMGLVALEDLFRFFVVNPAFFV